MNMLFKAIVVPLLAMVAVSCANHQPSSDISNRVRLQDAISAVAETDLTLQVNQSSYRIGDPIVTEMTLDKPLTGYLSVLVVDESDQVNLLLPNAVKTANGPIGFLGSESLRKYLPTDLVATAPGGKNFLVVLITSLPFNLYYRHCVHPAEPNPGCDAAGTLTLDENMIQNVINKIKNPQNRAAYSLVSIMP